MKTSESNLVKSAVTNSQYFANSGRRLVFGLLQKIQKGSLLLVEDNSEHHFGEPRQHAEVQATVIVKDSATYMMLLGNGSLGAGEAYMAGYWESPGLLQVIRIFVLNMDLLQQMDNGGSLIKRIAGKCFQLMHRNTLKGARTNIPAHYDLSNDFFSLFLDPGMSYSSAIYADEDQELEDASVNKFRHVCEQLKLQDSDHLLEIGTGWGGLAIYAAREYGCRVTTTTLSHAQAEYARAWISSSGLEERITVLEKDYRDLEAVKYDKLVSIEMIEAVGAEFYTTYFQCCSSLLKSDGLMLIQAITISDQRFAESVKSIDFIKRYIFPGGQLPSNSVIAQHIANDTDMQLLGMLDITRDYARTIKAWRNGFQGALDDVRNLGFDENFIRMWRFYLCFCEGSFMERVIHTGQFLLAKPGFRNS